MKKFRFVLPMLVLAISFALSAFTVTSGEAKQLNQLWYEFTGSNPNVATDYQILGDGNTAPSCQDGSVRCAVKASAHPELGSEYPNLDDQNIEIRDKD
jgi:hypothetical protein